MRILATAHRGLALSVLMLVFCLPSLAKEPDVLEQLLQDKITLARTLVSSPAVSQTVIAQNTKWRGLSKSDIAWMDDQWKGSTPDDAYDRDVIQPIMTGDCAKALLDFQAVDPDYEEIFITDAQGLNACQTNKTSDFYQADEEWWVKAYARGAGREYSGTIEYDENVRLQSIPIYLPVKDPSDGRVIGVCKALIGLATLVDEL